MPIGLHHRATDTEARLAVEEAAFYYIGTDEIDARAEDPWQDARLFAAFVI